MSAIPPSFQPDARDAAPVEGVDAIEARWEAIVEAGRVVAQIAGENAEQRGFGGEDFGALLREGEAWRRERVEAALIDLTAIMEMGVSTLLSIQERGSDPAPAAERLWQEFCDAAGSILALLPPGTRAHRREDF